MTYLLLAWLMILGGGIGALAAGRRPRLASGLAVAAVWGGSLAAAVPVAATLAGRPPAALAWAWSVPTGGLTIALDGLSAFFCLPVLILAPLAALYGRAYLAHDTRRPGPVWFFYNLLIASLTVVLAARDGMLFLVAWEIMAVASFGLIMLTSSAVGLLLNVFSPEAALAIFTDGGPITRTGEPELTSTVPIAEA